MAHTVGTNAIEIRALYVQGYAPRQIAVRLGLTHEHVQKIFDSYVLTTPTERGESKSFLDATPENVAYAGE